MLARYPRAPKGRSRVVVLMERLDSMLRDPPPAQMLRQMRARMAELAELGIEAMDD